MENIMPSFALLRQLASSTHAGVTSLAALALPVLIGSAGLAFDINRGYQQRIINQRAADMGALGAALAYKTSNSASVLQPTAQDIAIANGLSGATVTAVLLQDTPTTGEQAVRVTVNDTVPFILARVLGFTGNFTVNAQSLALLSGGTSTYASPCFLALDGGTSAITVTGGASINAPTCTVAAVGEIENKGTLIRGADIISGSSNIYVNHGALEANTLRFATTFDKPHWNNNVPPPEDRVNEATTLGDPWANDSNRTAALSQLGQFTAPPTLSNPNTPNGSNWDFDWNPGNNTKDFRIGTSGNYIVPAGNYTIKKFEVGGGINVTFEDGSVITVSQGVSIGGGSNVDFGDADLYVNGGFNSGSNGVTIGDGELWIGSGQINWNGTNTKGDGNVIINDELDLGGGQHLVMGDGDHFFESVDVGGGGTVWLGDGALYINDGITVGGDSEVLMGDGEIRIGPGNGNRAIKLNGSAKFIMGDGPFSANGDINTVGGSVLVFGRTPNHYINGDVNIAGSALFGAGRYTIDGDLSNGTGGTTFPWTSILSGDTYGDYVEGESTSGYDMVGINVTFILSGTMNLAGGAKSKIEAATTSQTGGYIEELLITTNNTSDANWTGGSQNAYYGTLHFPNAQIKMAGGNVTAGDKCMTVIADTIRVNGGAVAASACDRMEDITGGGNGSGSVGVRLIG